MRHCQRGSPFLPPIGIFSHYRALQDRIQPPRSPFCRTAIHPTPDRFCFVTIFRHLVPHTRSMTMQLRRGWSALLDDGINRDATWLMGTKGERTPDPISNSTPRRFDGCTRLGHGVFTVFSVLVLWWVIFIVSRNFVSLLLFLFFLGKIEFSIWWYNIRYIFDILNKIVRSTSIY